MSNNEKPTRSHTEAPDTKSPSGKPRSGKSAAEQNRIISTVALCTAAVAVLIGLIIGAVFLFTEQEGTTTMNANVYIAGINTYGMSKEDALSAVQLTAQHSYPEKALTVTVGKVTVELTPDITGASLDVEAAVNAAFDASYVTNRHYIFDLTPYLNLNTQAIMDELDALGMQFGTPLTQTTYKVTGQLPDLSVADSNEPHQVLEIVVGTPEYQLDMLLLYQDVLDAYNQSVFYVEAECPKIEPDPLDIMAIQTEYFHAPVNATIDPETFAITPETYGYTFDAAAVQEMLKNAAYGDILQIPFMRIAPAVTVENMNESMYRDVLSTFTVTAKSDPNRNINLHLACQAINGTILYPGDIFSFNNTLGERTEAKGYRPAASYLGYETVNTIGGGICQVSSALYYCALLADLETIERDSHTFAPDYMPLGADAVINWKTLDFRFRNNSTAPIQIEATAEGGTVTVSLRGVDTKSYYVLIESEVLKTLQPHKIYQVVNPGNGYTDGQVISTPYTGYEVNIYRCKYNKEDNSLISKELEAFSKYSSRNEVIIKVEQQPPEPVPPEPSVPDTTGPEPTGPDASTPDVTLPEVTLPEVTVPEVTTEVTTP